MRGLDWSRVPASSTPVERRGVEDAAGADKPCDSGWVQFWTLGHMLGLEPCRDTVDLQRLEEGWSSIAADMTGHTWSPADIGQSQVFIFDKAKFDAWDRDMRAGGSDFTTFLDQIQAFDAWGAKLQGWRDWYAAHAGGSKPSGPDVVPPSDPSSDGGAAGGIFGGLTKSLGSATTLILVGVGAYLLISAVKK